MLGNLINQIIKYKLNINVVMLVTLTSMVFFYPFDNQFRFTLGSAVLAILLLYFRQLPVLSTTIFSGLAIVVLRICVYFFLYNANLGTLLTQHLPAFTYYVTFGIVFYHLDVRRSLDNMPLIVLKLSAADIAGNLTEIIFRSDLNNTVNEVIITGIIAVGVIRAILAVYGYYGLKQYQNFVLAEDQFARYTEMTMMVAKLRAELFYLKKSSQDIEEVMGNSYWLYNQLNTELQAGIMPDSACSGKALAIARSIHEIKKDYYRVINGIENVLKPTAVEPGMTLAEIMSIVEQNTLRVLQTTNRDIHLECHSSGNLVITKHYTLVSILDNLLMNAIEACGEGGRIKVTQSINEDYVEFRVEDNGCGIPPSDYAIIFKPGYSTKFSPDTGRMPTGLGLVHVKNLTEQLNGTVKVASEPGNTCFTVVIPCNSLTV